MEKKFNIIYTGRLIEGKASAQVRENLSGVYGQRCDDHELEAFFTGRMIVLSRNLVYEDADKTLDIFEDAGLECVAVPEEIEEPKDKVLINGDYNLIYAGTFKKGFEIDQVRENINKIYGKRGSDQIIDLFFTEKPLILMKNINQKVAKMNLLLFEQAGLECVIEPAGGMESAVSPEMENVEDTPEEDSLKVFVDSGKPKSSSINISHLTEGLSPLLSISQEIPIKSRFIKADNKLAVETFCQNCRGKFSVGQEIVRCDKCGVYYDKPCWEKNGGCIQPQCANIVRRKTTSHIVSKKAYKIDTDQDVKDVKSAIIAGILSGIMTLIVVIASRLSKYDITGLGYGMYTLLDIAVIYILIFGVYMRSRSCAVILFLYFVGSRTYIVINTGQIPGWFIVFLFGYLYYRGIRGTFGYHKTIAIKSRERKDK
jgi:hypothetical protein